MSFVFADLPWLPPAATDFTARRRALSDLDDGCFGPEAARLATARLTSSQSAALGRRITDRLTAGGRPAGLEPLTLAVLAGGTCDLLLEQMPAAAARHGVALRVLASSYDQVEQAVLDEAGLIATLRPDVTLLAVDHRWLRLDRASFDQPDAALEAAIARLDTVLDGLQRQGGGTAILCTLPTPPETVFGSLDALQPQAVARAVGDFNAAVVSRVLAGRGVLLDVAALAARIGTDAWFDPVAWHGAKLAFSPAFDAAFAEMLARLLAALRGRSRKALVLDLDNTLWGGVVGDDGIDGLLLGSGHSAGEAFAAVQDYAVDLHRRGVFLAVSSKNDDAIAREAFSALPGMRLKLDDVAVFKANWESKPDNLVAIAQALNIGLDALVLLDDNPAERGQVRATLPEVAVPELPADPSLFARHLAAAGYFETVSFSAEDSVRAAGAKAQAERTEVRRRSAELGDYLASLEMKLTVSPFDARSRTRVTQLINKTNQFNLTGRRYTEAEVAEREVAQGAVTLQAHLEDRFGDLGLIAALIAAPVRIDRSAALMLDTWVMSCRVLGRGVEDALFGELLANARARGVAYLDAMFRPTPKNAPIAGLLPRLGFQSIAASDDEIHYRLRIADAAPSRPLLQVRSAR